MIPASPTTSIAWTAAAAPAVAPVPAVMAVAPAAPAARDGQANLEQRRGQPRSVPATATSADRVAEDRAKASAERAVADQARVQRQEEQAQRVREQAQIQQEAMEHLRSALRKVWDASGAVVDQAMARDHEVANAAGRARSVEAYGAPAAMTGKPGLSRLA